MRKSTIFNWILSVPGYWRTSEGFILSTIERPAPTSRCWYKFNGIEFIARGCLEAQQYAENLIMANSNDNFKM